MHREMVVDSTVVDCARGEPQVRLCFQVELYFNILMALGAICTACSDVVVDSIVVERSHGEPQVRPAMAFPRIL